MFYYSGKLHILLSIDWKKTCSYTTVVLSAGMYLFILVYREKLNKDFLFCSRNCGFFLFVTDVLLSFFIQSANQFTYTQAFTHIHKIRLVTILVPLYFVLSLKTSLFSMYCLCYVLTVLANHSTNWFCFCVLFI